MTCILFFYIIQCEISLSSVCYISSYFFPPLPPRLHLVFLHLDRLALPPQAKKKDSKYFFNFRNCRIKFVGFFNDISEQKIVDIQFLT